MRFQLPNSNEHVNLNPGDPIPYGIVESWPNPGLWAKRHYIARIDGLPFDMNMRASYQPPRALTEADLERSSPERRSSPFHQAGPDGIGPGEGKASAVQDPSDAELDREPAPAAPIDPKKLAELQARTRRELLNLAAQKNLKVNSSDSKEDLIHALSA
jgi:hypothetical protein